MKRLFMVCVLLIVAFPLFASKGVFYRISNGENHLYLLGTVHLGNLDFYPLSSEITKAFHSSDIYVIEALSDEIDGEFYSAFIRSNAYFLDKRRLKDVVEKNVYRSLIEFVENDERFSVSEFERMRPWFASLLVEQIAIKNIGLKSSLGIDKYFLNKARALNMRVLELESAMSQIKLFANLTSEEEVYLLENALKHTLKEKEEAIVHLLEAWVEGDEKELEAILFSSFSNAPKGLFDAVFTKRNEEMLKKIKAFIASENLCFVAVGAGHLLGKMGLISLLRASGFKASKL